MPEPTPDAPWVSLADVEAAAALHAERTAWDYIRGGADDERTLARNREAFAELPLRPRMLVDVSTVDPSTTVLGTPVRLPVLAAPVGLQRLVHPDGELATARAVGAAGSLMAVSTASTCSVEAVAEAATGPLWFQLYVFRDRAHTATLVRRAERAGYRAIVLTADAQRAGNRERDVRNRFAVPAHLTLPNLPPTHVQGPPSQAGRSAVEAHVDTVFDPALSWRDLAWLRSLTDLPILLKGVLTAEDAHLAAEHGLDGIVVSNHGGRQLDGTLATIEALPEVVQAVDGRCEVYLDGGVRRGTDVLKAIALGARAVLIGRPLVHGLAAGGQAGVEAVFRILEAEVRRGMALAGRATVSDIDASLVRRPG